MKHVLNQILNISDKLIPPFQLEILFFNCDKHAAFFLTTSQHRPPDLICENLPRSDTLLHTDKGTHVYALHVTLHYAIRRIVVLPLPSPSPCNVHSTTHLIIQSSEFLI